eukprot:CCRYP_012543-RA/>CCRYP_012543-RA protein AED:0.32 eAED:0.32 QI:243/1/1/1/1/1/3/1091/255
MARASFLFMAPGLLGALAFILSGFGGVYCKFLSHISTGGLEQPITINSGIWYYQGYAIVNTTVQGTVVLETCNNYPDNVYIDPKWKSARAFATMALIIGGCVTFWGLLAGCLYPNKAAYKLGGILMMLCCLFQGLTFLFLDSEACHNNSLTAALEQEISLINLTFEDSCVLAAGGKCAIAATILWFLAALSAFKVDPPKRSPVTTQTHDVTYTKTTNPDGTTVISENVVKGEPVVVGAPQANAESAEVEAPPANN